MSWLQAIIADLRYSQGVESGVAKVHGQRPRGRASWEMGVAAGGAESLHLTVITWTEARRWRDSSEWRDGIGDLANIPWVDTVALDGGLRVSKGREIGKISEKQIGVVAAI